MTPPRVHLLLPLWLTAAMAVLVAQTPTRRVAQPSAPAAPRLGNPARIPTFHGDVQPILRAHCQSCHQKQGASYGGLVAPMPLTSFEEAAPWARAMATAVETKQMPPWLASGATNGVFVNERRLTAAQIATITTWARNGAPAGTPPAVAPPAPAPVHPDGWMLGEPNIDVKGEPHTLTDEANEHMVTFEVGELPDDFWVRGVEFLGGSTAVHHMCGALVFPPRVPLRPGVDRETSLGCAAPGAEPRLLPDGFAYFAPRGAAIRLDMHYFKPKGSGTVVDVSKIGLTLAKGSPTHRVRFNAAGNTNFEVPPGHADWRVGAAKTFDRETALLALWPHGHSRTSSVVYRAFYPDGRTETLLEVPHYDHRWEEIYTYRTPKVVPAGTRIEVVYRFDNSAARGGRKAFDAAQPVIFGPHASDEMMLGYIAYGQPVGGPPAVARGGSNVDAVDLDRLDRLVASLEGQAGVTLEFSRVPVTDPAYASLERLASGVVRLTSHGIMKLKTAAPLSFGSVQLKPGNAAPGFPGLYGLWLRRSGAGWRLAVTNQPDVWGTQFDQASVVAEIPLRHERITAGDAGFEPRMELLDEGARLTIAWGRHIWTSDFRVLTP